MNKDSEENTTGVIVEFTGLKLEGKYLPFLFKDKNERSYVKSKAAWDGSIFLEFADNLTGSFGFESDNDTVKNPGIFIIDVETGVSIEYIQSTKNPKEKKATTDRVGCMTKRINI